MSSGNEFPISLSDIIPLHLVSGSSSRYGYFMAKALLEQGSDPNAEDSSGLTPVHVAASWGNYETLKLLLLNGGNPCLEDNDGKTPLDLASQENHKECVKLLSWWLENSNGSSTPTTPTSPSHYGYRSPNYVDYCTPKSSPSYKPKYFSSPISGSPNSPLSGYSVSPAAKKTCGFSPRNPSGRRQLRYDESKENYRAALKRTSDQKCFKLESSNVPAPPVEKLVTPTQEPWKVEQTETKPAENGEVEDDHHLEPSLNELKIVDRTSDGSLSLLNDAMAELSRVLDETLELSDDKKKAALAILETTIAEEDEEIDPKRLSECNKLTDAELRRRAINLGMDVGPITPGTRFLYVRRLACLMNSDKIPEKQKYLPEIQAAIEGRLNEPKCREDEAQLRLSFDSSLDNGGRRWREGCLKMSFCYLLLDPSITQDLPTRASNMTESQRLETFIDAIFYVGKGKKTRPFQHLLDAACRTQTNPKSEKILSLWERGYGVISLHIFQNIIPVEAYTREAAMIDSIGLDQLCNFKRGDYYGAAANWTLGRRRRFGAYLLKLAAGMFFLEGERPLKREDVLKSSSG